MSTSSSNQYEFFSALLEERANRTSGANMTPPTHARELQKREQKFKSKRNSNPNSPLRSPYTTTDEMVGRRNRLNNTNCNFGLNGAIRGGGESKIESSYALFKMGFRFGKDYADETVWPRAYCLLTSLKRARYQKVLEALIS